MPDAHARAEHRRLVGAEAFDQEPRDRIDRHHQGEQLAVAAAERVVGQQQQAQQQAIDGAQRLRRLHGQTAAGNRDRRHADRPPAFDFDRQQRPAISASASTR